MSHVSLSRRRLLQILAAASLVGCAPEDGDGGGPDGDDTDTGSAAGDPVADWEGILLEVRDLVRASPGHRTAEAARLVAEGDPEAILAFVRDRIAWHPGYSEEPYHGDFSTSTDARREGVGNKYGSSGALRSGGGSALDRAELLRDLLVDAGFADAELVGVDIGAFRPDDPSELFLRDWRGPEPQLEVPEDVLARWEAVLGGPVDADGATLDPIDPDGTRVQALVDRLLAAFPEDEDPADRAREVDWNRVRDVVPVVRFTHEGEVTYANPAWGEATLAEPGFTDGDFRDLLEDPPPPLPVTLRLEARTTRTGADFDDAEVLVEATFGADEVIGRQVLVSTVPVADAQGLVTVPAVQHRAFLPMIAVQDLHGDPDVPDPVTGSAVTLGASRIEVDADDRVLVDGVPVDDPAAPPADVSAVTDVRVSCDGSTFPTVFARVWPTDADGDVVDGLTSSDLVVTDEGLPTPILLRSNRRVPVAILLRDTSLSMPAAYRGEEGEQRLEDLAAAIEAAYPGATVTQETTGSYLWNRLASAASEGPNVVVYLTDGDVFGDLTPEIEAALTAGPPAILVGVEGPTDTLQEMADLTGGALVDVSDPEELEDVVLGVLETLDIPPYTMVWQALEDGPTEREVEVTVGSASGTGTYEALGGREPRRILALDLVVSVGPRTVRRTLGGWPSEQDFPDDLALRDQLHTEVHHALLGGRLISFEGDGPSPEMALDDLIAARLGLLPWLRASERGLDANLDVLMEGLPLLPESLLAAMEPLPRGAGGEPLTFPAGLRAAMLHSRPGTDGQQHAVLDLLDVAQWRTVTAEGTGEANFMANLAATARLALLEEDVADTSTVSLLSAEALTILGGRPFQSQDDAVLEDRWRGLLSSYGAHRIGPASGQPQAFFVLDDETGALHAVLPDGSGGADQIIEVLQILDHAIAIACVVGGLGPALTVVSAYGITLVRLYAAVATALEGFVTAGLDEEVRCALESFACTALIRITFPPMLKAGNRAAGAVLGSSLCDVAGVGEGC